MTDIVQTVRKFTEAIGCTTDRYNARQTALYTGLQCEELSEKIEALICGIGQIENPSSHIPILRLMHLRDILHDVSMGMKEGEFDKAVEFASRDEVLDADIDLAWVTIGSALSQGADVDGALGEVARANLSKLVKCPDCCGLGVIRQGYAPDDYWDEPCDCYKGQIAMKDANGKVVKPAGWVAPNIMPFVCHE